MLDFLGGCWLFVLTLLMFAATFHRDLSIVPGRQGLNQLHWLQATVALLDRGEGELAALSAASQRLLHAAV